MNKKTKVYDWSGTLISIAGFMDYFKANHPELYHQYTVLGAKDKELKRRVRPQAIRIFEDATNSGLYEVGLLPNVRERLELDRQGSYVRTIFTSSPREVLINQIKGLGVGDCIDEIVVLDDIIRSSGVESIMKEDPMTFRYLMDLLRVARFDLRSYTDDSQGRVVSAVSANKDVAGRGLRGFERMYLLDSKQEVAQNSEEGYIRINDLMLVD